MAEVGSDMDCDVEGANHEEENQTIVTFKVPGQAEDYTFNFDDEITTQVQAIEPLLADIFEK